MTTNDTLNETFAKQNSKWEDPTYAGALWVTVANEWRMVQSYDDPYKGIAPLVSLMNQAVLEMFGWATHFETGERTRVRVLFSAPNYSPTVSVQMKGSDELITQDSVSGAFMDEYESALNSL